jgi:CDP-diacylglycerol--serine O-phosphatidyltransferase
VVARRVLRVRHRRDGRGTLTVEPYPYPSLYPRRSEEIASITPSGDAYEADWQLRAAAAAEEDAGLTPIPLLPGDRTVARQVRFLIVNSCTLSSLGLGVLAILLAMRGDVPAAALCVLCCVILDGMDGMLARQLGVSSPFGAQMDSLADMCAFGIATPVVVYASVAGSVPAPAAAAASALVAVCAAIRLARFNISPKDSRFFTGVPTTLAAVVLAAAVLIDLPLPPHALLLGAVGLALAMVSGFPYARLAQLVRLPPWLWLAPVAAAFVNLPVTFLALVTGYLASGPILWLHHRRAT